MANNQNIKILLVGPIDTKGRYSGGIAYIVNSLLSARDTFFENGVELVPVDSCCIQRKSNASGRFSFDNLINTICLVNQIKKKIKDENPNVLYFNTSRKYSLLKDLLVLKLVGRKKNVKTILHIHFANVKELFPPQTFLKRRCKKLIAKYVDHLVLLSEKTKDDLIVDGYRRDKISVLYNFHTLNFTQEEIAIKEKNALKKQKKDVVFIGSLDKRKGIIDLMDAFADCVQYARLHVCGQFTNKEVQLAVETRLKEFPLDSVVMHGFVNAEEKRNLLNNCEILALPSYGEGFPIVLVEGLAAGCEIIATNVGAIPEVFDEKTGKVISSGDIVGLKESLLDLIQEKEFDIMMNNWELSREFTLDSFIKKMCAVCLGVKNE